MSVKSILSYSHARSFSDAPCLFFVGLRERDRGVNDGNFPTHGARNDGKCDFMATKIS